MTTGTEPLHLVVRDDAQDVADGRSDLSAELRAETLGELSQVLERVRPTQGIANTETSILLATFR